MKKPPMSKAQIINGLTVSLAEMGNSYGEAVEELEKAEERADGVSADNARLRRALTEILHLGTDEEGRIISTEAGIAARALFPEASLEELEELSIATKKMAEECKRVLVADEASKQE